MSSAASYAADLYYAAPPLGAEEGLVIEDTQTAVIYGVGLLATLSVPVIYYIVEMDD